MLKIKDGYYIVLRNVNDIRIAKSDVTGSKPYKVSIEFTNGSMSHSYIDVHDKEQLEFRLATIDSI